MCGSWIHVRCTNIPAEALNVLEFHGVSGLRALQQDHEEADKIEEHLRRRIHVIPISVVW